MPVTGLVNCITAVLDGQIVLPDSLSPAWRRPGDAAQLTAREIEVLKMLAEGTSGARPVVSFAAVFRQLGPR
jgi:DNA-binding NarL/FixJ family response regulator